MFNGSNWNQKSQFSGILSEPLNPRELLLQVGFYAHKEEKRNVFGFKLPHQNSKYFSYSQYFYNKKSHRLKTYKN